MSGTYNATIRRVVISAWIGNSIEYYDLTATLSSFASFGVGFIS
ncbi:MHS family MFS transporter, partial [Salmonella enterica]